MGERLEQEAIKGTNNNIRTSNYNNNNNNNNNDNDDNNNNNSNGMFHSFEKALFKRIILMTRRRLSKRIVDFEMITIYSRVSMQMANSISMSRKTR